MNKNDLLGIIYFSLVFVFVCFFALIFSSGIYYITPIQHFIQSVSNPPDLEGPGIGALIVIVLLLYCIKFIQLAICLIASIWIIKKSKNQSLLKLYNTWQTPTLVLLIFYYFDMTAKHYYLDEYVYKTYELLFSPFWNFIPIYIIAMLNNLRLYLKSHNIFKNKKPE